MSEARRPHAPSGSVAEAAVPEAAHPRTLTWVGTTALAVGGSNQSLFLVGALVLAQGTAAVPLLVIGLLLSWAAAFGWTELVLMSPDRVGGIAAACARAFRPYSPVLANLTGVCYWWGWVPTCGLTAILSASAIHQWYLPGVPVEALASGLVITFAGVNLCGVRWVARLAIPLACVSAALGLLSALVPVVAGTVNWQRAASFHLVSPFHGTFGALTSAMAGLYLIGFAAPAFEAAACHVGETRDPARNVPRAMLASALLASLYFLVLPVVWLGALGPHGLEGHLARTLGPTFAPLLGSSAKAAAIGFMVFNMFHGTLQPLAGASRTLAQLSEDGLLPRLLARRARTDVPWVATLLTATMAIAFLLIGDPVSLIAAANFTYLIGIGMPSVAVWLLRRNEPGLSRPYRAPRGTIVLGVLAAAVWVLTTVLGFEQFGLPTVITGLIFAYLGALFYGARSWSDRRRSGLRGIPRSLHLKLTGAMVGVIALDGMGYLIAIDHLSRHDRALEAVLEDIFVAVALLTVSVGLVLPGMIAHAAGEVAEAAARLGRSTITEIATAMAALGRGDLDWTHALPETTPVVVHSRDELGLMAANFNDMQERLAGAALALGGAREGLRSTRDRLQRNNAQQAAVAQLGQRALEGAELNELLQEATHTVAEVLGIEFALLLEFDPTAETLRPRSSFGLPAETVGGLRFVPGDGSQSAHTLASGELLIVEDWATEDRFTPSAAMLKLNARSGATVPIDGGERPYGVLGVASTRPCALTADEVDFLHAIANVLADAVARSRSQSTIVHAALHDALTGLPNRALFADRLGVALGNARRTHSHVGVLFLDLDNFKMVNDSRGHAIGDRLLMAVAGRLDESLRPGDTVARFGGDEFVVVCADVADADDAGRIADRLREVFSEPFALAGREHYLSASIGIALSAGPLQEVDELIANADAAMYRAKELGRGRSALYDHQMRDQLMARARVHDELRHVIERDELLLHYQPIVSLASGDVIGLEALVRWQHPERGLVGPDEFIPAAEQNGMIVPVGRWVLERACRQLSAWNRARDPGLAPLSVAVNVSTRQLEDQALPATVERLVDEYQLTPGQLHLEITESALVADSHDSLTVLRRLKDIGVELVLDDFGTGYSSLAYLRRFPIDALKIDRSFIADLGQSADGDAAIVEAILNMALGLGIAVIAEGVETRAQADRLLALRCQLAQGWLYAPALPAEKLAPLLPTGEPLSVSSARAVAD